MLAARVKKMITARARQKKKALLVCSQRPFDTPNFQISFPNKNEKSLLYLVMKTSPDTEQYAIQTVNHF